MTADNAALAARLRNYGPDRRREHADEDAGKHPTIPCECDGCAAHDAADFIESAALLAAPETLDEPCQHGNAAWAMRSYCPCADCVVARHETAAPEREALDPKVLARLLYEDANRDYPSQPSWDDIGASGRDPRIARARRVLARLAKEVARG